MTAAFSIIRSVPPENFSHQIAIPAPVTGVVVAAAFAASPLARSGLLGNGTALRCSSSQIVSPFAGWVESCPAAGYRVTLRHSCGLRFNLSFGPDTHRLMGERCGRLVKAGQKVKAGTPLLIIDPIWLKQQGIEPVCTVSVAPEPGLQALVITTAKRLFAMEDTLFTLYTY